MIERCVAGQIAVSDMDDERRETATLFKLSCHWLTKRRPYIAVREKGITRHVCTLKDDSRGRVLTKSMTGKKRC